MKRDYDSMTKMENYARQRSLLDLEAIQNSINTSIMNIATGTLTPTGVNVHKAKEVGDSILKNMVGSTPSNYIFRRNLQAVQIPVKLTSTSSISVRKVDTETILKKLALLDVNDFEEDFSFELASYPPALYSTDGKTRPPTPATD